MNLALCVAINIHFYSEGCFFLAVLLDYRDFLVPKHIVELMFSLQNLVRLL